MPLQGPEALTARRETDTRRAINVYRIRLLGMDVIRWGNGMATFKDAIRSTDC